MQAVKIGIPRTYTCDLGIIEHLSLKTALFFGFVQKGAIKYATPEKTFLDACYFYYKGRRFSFDLYEDVNLEALIQEKHKRQPHTDNHKP